MSDALMLRIWIVVAGVLLMAAIVYFGRPRKTGQGKRRPGAPRGEAGVGRIEPTLGELLQQELGDGEGGDGDARREGDDEAAGAAAAHGAGPGRRVSDEFDKIVTLYIAARAGEKLRGPDIVVAAEKAGLTYGHMNVYHRLVEGHPDRGPVFSVANIMKPGSFDMATIQSLETPAIAFFLTLPAPVSALDAWETMLPTAERMTELLGGVLLDESRSALGRQRIQHIREELRAWDRQQEAPPPSRSRW
jgi:cell division protein ZipA